MHCLLSFLIVSAVIFGCYQRYEIYGYKSEEVKYDWGSIGVRMIGEKVDEKGKIIRKAPYELFLWFNSDSLRDAEVQVFTIELNYAENNKLIYQGNETLNSTFQKEADSYSAYFSVKNLTFEYKDIKCDIQYAIKTDDEQTKYRAIINLKSDFKKYKHIESH